MTSDGTPRAGAHDDIGPAVAVDVAGGDANARGKTRVGGEIELLNRR